MILQNVEIWYAKLGKPSSRYNKDNPTWELQVRTTDKEIKKEWEARGLNVRAFVPDEGLPYFRVNLRKRSVKEDGEPAFSPTVVDGDLNPVDPDTIGNGSIANVRIFQYSYPDADGRAGTASVLMGVQLVRHIVYQRKGREDNFVEIEKTVVIDPEVTE